MYAFKYARDGTEPELKGLEKTVWKHIQNRMDYDKEQWIQTKQQRSNAGKNHKGNQYTRVKRQNGTDLEQNGTNGTVYVTDTVNVSVSDTVTEFEDELNECAERAFSKSNKPFVSEKSTIPTPRQGLTEKNIKDFASWKPCLTYNFFILCFEDLETKYTEKDEKKNPDCKAGTFKTCHRTALAEILNERYNLNITEW